MMKDAPEYIKSFVNYGFTMKPDLLIKCNFSIIIVALMGFGYGIILKGTFLVWGWSMMAFAGICIVVNLLLRDRTHTAKEAIFLLTGMTFFYTSIEFLLMVLITAQLYADTFLLAGILTIIYMLLVMLNLSIFILLIKKGIYNTMKSVRRTTNVSVASLGGALGYLVPRIFFRDVSQEFGLLLMIIAGFFVSVMMSTGYPHFLKYYYIKKYSLDVEIRTMEG